MTAGNSTQTVTTNPFAGLPLVPENDPSLTTPASSAVPRAIARTVPAELKSEGVGARVRRSIGVPKLRNLAPFLMLDHFVVGAGAGFADHPHRGFETVTYMLTGSTEHEDFSGARGVINAGDLQFMTAGRGVVHAEMPRPGPDGAPPTGLQLWVDLPRALKYCEPRYRDLRAAEIPTEVSADGRAEIKVIAGRTRGGVESAKELSYTPVWMLDVTLRPGGRIEQPLPRGWTAFAYVMDGSVAFGAAGEQRVVERYNNVVFRDEGDSIVAELDAGAERDARFVLFAGMKHDQPIVQYGPFVLNTPEEVRKALADYQTFSNGFERAKDWESEIGKGLM
jgi:redox-sensitive bicupin YhaK (pirin superfamily)